VASAAAEAESGSSDGGHPVRHVLILLRRHYGKLAAALLLAAALGVLWWALPVRPRIAWHTNNRSRLLELSDDGRVLLTHVDHLAPDLGHRDSGMYGQLDVWNTDSGQLRAMVLGQDRMFLNAELAPDGRHVAVWFNDPEESLRLFATETGKQIASFANSAGRRFSPDGRTFAFDRGLHYGKSETVLWDIGSSRARFTLQDNGDIAFSPDGRYLATLSSSSTAENGRPAQLRLYDTATGRMARTCSPMLGDCHFGGIVFSGDSQTVGIVSDASLDLDIFMTAKAQELAAWDTTADEQYFWFQRNDQEILQGTVRHPLETWYRLRQAGEFVKLLNLRTGQEIMTYPFPATIRELRYRGDSYCLLPPANRGNADPEFLFVARPCNRTRAWQWLISWLPANIAQSFDSDTELTFWHVPTRACLASMNGNYRDFRLAANGRCFATINGGNRIEIWDIPPRKPLGLFLTIAGLLLMLTIGGFWWQARRRKRKAALATEAISCGMC
jgi:WD40 repeat protein